MKTDRICAQCGARYYCVGCPASKNRPDLKETCRCPDCNGLIKISDGLYYEKDCPKCKGAKRIPNPSVNFTTAKPEDKIFIPCDKCNETGKVLVKIGKDWCW